MKYLGTSLPRKVQNLYSENCKTLLKEIKVALNKFLKILCSWIGSLNIVKVAILPKLIYGCNTTHVQIPADFFVKTDKLDLKFIYNSRDSEYKVAKTIFKKKNKVGRLTFPDFKTYYRDSPGGTVVGNPPASAGDTGWIPALGRFHMPQSN